MTTKNKLKQTKGTFKLRGKIKGLDSDKAIREGVTRHDKVYKAISFNVQTSPNNSVRVELFGQERDVIFYSSKEKKSKRVPFENRDKVALKGYALMGTQINSTGKKDQRKAFCEYDAVDVIKEEFQDGDSVFISGSINFNEYTNAHGDVVKKVQYNINSISKQNEEIDFDSEDFKEHAFFTQEVAIVDTYKDEEDDNKLFINGKTIDYRGDLTDCQFVVYSERLPKFAKTLHRTLKLGDFIELKGWVVSRVEFEKEETDEDLEDDWGGETPEGLENNYIREYINELEVINKGAYEEGKYTEEQLFPQEVEDYGEDIDVQDEEDGQVIEEDEDEELPFA